MTAGYRRVERFQISLSIAYDSWWNDTPFDHLGAQESCLGKCKPDQRVLYRRKGEAVRHKWEMMRIAAAELDAVCDHVVIQYRSGMPLSLSSYLTLKIESFLTISRSLLDVLSTCLAIHMLANSRVQSFNDLRKRKDCPDWLKEYAQVELVRSNGEPLSKTGWLSLLVTEKSEDPSLRDFVVHRGVAKYIFRELPFDEGWDLVFQPKSGDEYALPIKDVVKKICKGVDQIAALVQKEFGMSPT